MKTRLFFRLLGPIALLLAVQSAVAATHPSTSILVVVFLLLTALAALLLLTVSRRVVKIEKFAREIAVEDPTRRLLPLQNDELGDVEEALNRAADRLAQAGLTLQESENRHLELMAMLNSMQEAVVAVNPEGLVRWSNSSMERVAGVQVRPGRPVVLAFRDPELLTCLKKALGQRKVAVGRASLLAEGRIFEINAAPLPSGGALAVLHDVTRIEAAERSRKDFVANVSHELRTPLTLVQGYVETLLDGSDPRPPSEREFLEIIHKSSVRMGRLTEDLLTLAGLESPDYKVNTCRIPADDLVSDAFNSLGGLVLDAGVDLVDVGVCADEVLADPDAISQVFGNLIQNALKYGIGTPRVEIGAVRVPGFVQFSVRDFGQGIASEHLKRIFERFYRADKSRSRESGGTGLGLAIVRQIVLAHGGTVWAESELGSGTAFHFRLPLAEVPARQG